MFRFLVCNLAMADFFMGLYLGEFAIVNNITFIIIIQQQKV